MNAETVEFCKKEINDLLKKKLIRNSKSPWSCSAFYVQKNAEIERGTPRLVINYKWYQDIYIYIYIYILVCFLVIYIRTDIGSGQIGFTVTRNPT